MTDKNINIRLRLIIIKHNKVLLMYDSIENYFFYVGGKLEYGESLSEGIQREIKEECGDDATFQFKKILYIRDFIVPEKAIHNLELFILGDINKYEELENLKDPEFKGKKWLSWVNIDNLPENLYPTKLSKKLFLDYKNNFPIQGEYLGKI